MPSLPCEVRQRKRSPTTNAEHARHTLAPTTTSTREFISDTLRRRTPTGTGRGPECHHGCRPQIACVSCPSQRCWPQMRAYTKTTSHNNNYHLQYACRADDTHWHDAYARPAGSPQARSTGPSSGQRAPATATAPTPPRPCRPVPKLVIAVIVVIITVAAKGDVLRTGGDGCHLPRSAKNQPRNMWENNKTAEQGQHIRKLALTSAPPLTSSRRPGERMNSAEVAPPSSTSSSPSSPSSPITYTH